MAKISRAEAEAMGFTVDTRVYPWFAYKGPRFRPEMSQQCLTDAETALANMLAKIAADGTAYSQIAALLVEHTGRGVIEMAVAKVA